MNQLCKRNVSFKHRIVINCNQSLVYCTDDFEAIISRKVRPILDLSTMKTYTNLLLDNNTKATQLQRAIKHG